MDKHFPHEWAGNSVTYFSIDDISDDLSDYDNSCIFDSEISLNYDDLCIQMFYHEPTFEIGRYTGDFQRLTSDEYECICQNTDESWLPNRTAWGLDQIDELTLNNKYCYPDMEDFDQGIDIYVLDTGILATHQEFDNGQVITSATYTPARTDIIDGHGTHVAGTAGGFNYGTSKHIKNIYDYNVFYGTASAFCFIENALIDIINILSNNNRRGIINMSIQSFSTSETTKTIFDGYFQQVKDVGGINIGCSGNYDRDANTSFPGYSSEIITVGAVGPNFVKASYSNWGDSVDIWGPGGANNGDLDDDITSAWHSTNTTYNSIAGCSMATPHISGVVANMLFVDPSLTQDEILDELISNTQQVTGDECDTYDCQFAFYGCGDCELPGCVSCQESPCLCNNDIEDPNCHICHSNGCAQCESGYFKKDYDYPCISCSDTFGEGCMFCQDFNGCGQCTQGYNRVYDSDCNLWICQQ